MQLKKDIKELEKIDEFIDDITKNLAMQPGSIFRIAYQYLKNWGVEIAPGNIGWIKETALQSYMNEYEGTGEEINAAIRRAIVATGLASRSRDEEGDTILNRNIAGMAVNNMMAMHDGKRKFVICDIGAGDGATTVAILDALARTEETRELEELCEFHLVEPSFKRIRTAVEERLEKHPMKVRYSIHTETHEGFIPMRKDGTLDIILSSAVYHHMPFPDYLNDLYDVLTPDGVILIGDWFYNIFEHPARIVPILEDLGLDRGSINRFRDYFGIPFDTKEINKDLTTEQERTNRKFRKYTASLAEELKKIGKKQYFIEGYELVSERMEKMKQAGFETDIDELRGKHRAFARTLNNVRKIYPALGEIACVISAGKKQIDGKKARK